MVCCFFGHRDTSDKVLPMLKKTIIDLIENKNVNLFYVGKNGNFDILAARLLNDLSQYYDFKFYIVITRFPKEESSNTLMPEGIECIHPKFAINYRNKWMLERSDYVITYVTSNISSGAAKFKELAVKKNKQVIELSQLSD